MNLHITGHNVEITPALGEYVNSKLERASRHFDHVISVSVILSVEKLSQCVNATVHLSGHDVHVEASDNDMYAAIDFMADKLDRAIVRHKEKLKENRRHAAGSGHLVADDDSAAV